MATNKQRVGIAGLAFSAAALVGVFSHEGYTDKAVIPVKGDVPTVGFGSTTRDDGTKVAMGDVITPQKAAARTLAHIQADERGLKACVREPLTQTEYDILVDFSYQYGVYRTCKSSIVKAINAKDYVGACKAYLPYKNVAGRDCSISSNDCIGVWNRIQDRYNRCMKEQNESTFY